MKLLTEIAPRRDGTVRAMAKDGNSFVFVADANGDLTCDVTDETLVATLLATGNFWPADREDYESAIKIVEPVIHNQAKADGTLDDEPGDDDDESNPNALPFEAQTPPVDKPPKKVGAKPHKAK